METSGNAGIYSYFRSPKSRTSSLKFVRHSYSLATFVLATELSPTPKSTLFRYLLKVLSLSRQLGRTQLDLNPEMQRLSNGNELSAAFESKVLNVAVSPE
ncbi:hypothetical protein TURU_067492 [Turdus rufiventris]|nr:hypothetical protein TURU_067492 [Turdus rufiventris]